MLSQRELGGELAGRALAAEREKLERGKLERKDGDYCENPMIV